MGIVQEVSEYLADEDLVDVDRRQIIWDQHVDRTRPECRTEGIDCGVCTISETVMGLRRTTRAPASIRVMSSRLVTRRVSRSVSISISAWSSSVSASESGVGGCSRVDDATFMVASGVRRSCDTAPTRACRRRSTSSSTSDRSARSRSCTRSSARAAWLAKVRSRALSASDAGMPRMASKPTGRPEAVSTTVRISSGRPGPVPRLTGTPDSGSSPRSSSGDSASPAEAAISRRSACRDE